VASYPYMVDLAGKGEWETLQELLGRSLRQLATFLLPATVFGAVFAQDLVRLAFRRGKFGEDAVVVVGGHLAVMIWCIFPWCLQIVLARALYARGKFWLGAGLGTLCVLFSWPLWTFLVDRWGIGGLGMGLVALVVLQAAVFAGVWFRQPKGWMAFSGLGIHLVEVGAVSTAAVVAARWGGGGFAGVRSGLVLAAAVAVVASWALIRNWPGVGAASTRIRTRFGIQ